MCDVSSFLDNINFIVYFIEIIFLPFETSSRSCEFNNVRNYDCMILRFENLKLAYRERTRNVVDVTLPIYHSASSVVNSMLFILNSMETLSMQ